MNDDFAEAGLRLFKDGDHLFREKRYGTATHLFGLSAECALKACMQNLLSASRTLPRCHLPELADRARLWFKGRRRSGIGQLLKKANYMEGWKIDNRYWQNAAFSRDQCFLFRDHSRRTLYAIEGKL